MVQKIAKRHAWILLFCLCSAQAFAAELYRVEKIFDGDTILLNDGRKVRFLGINTPEVAGDHKTEEPGGEAAKLWLQRRLADQPVRLEFDQELQDKYGRTLAHVFSQDQRHLNLELVKNGLAVVSIFPPNLKYAEALLTAQQSAEQARLGIWGMAEYAPMPYQQLSGENLRGWKRVTGKIVAVKQTAKSSYLQFSTGTAVQVDKQFEPLFPPLATYVGKYIEARGWPYKAGERYALTVKHPGLLKVIGP